MNAVRRSDIDLDVSKVPVNYTLDGYEIRVSCFHCVEGYPDEYHMCQIIIDGSDGKKYIGAYNYKDHHWNSKMYILLEDQARLSHN